MKRITLAVFLFGLCSSVFSENIAYNHVNGDIYQLDNSDVSRYVGNVDTTTGTISSEDILVNRTGSWLRYSFYDTSSGTVKSKSRQDIDIINKDVNFKDILDLKLRLAQLRSLFVQETDTHTIKLINRSTSAIEITITELLSR